MKASSMFRTVLFLALMGVAGIASYGQRPTGNANATEAPLPKDIHPETRSRMPLPKREEFDDYGKKVYDELINSSPATERLHSPKLAKPLADARHYLKYETDLGDRLIAIAVLATSRELDNQFEWTQWEEHSKMAGDPKLFATKTQVEPQIIDIIKYCKPVTGLGEKEATIIKLGREMFGTKKVSSATFADTMRLFGKRGTVDLVETMALYGATGAEILAFDVQLLKGQKPLLPARSSIPACSQKR